MFYFLGISENCKDNIVVVTREWKDLNENEDESETFHNDKKSDLESLKKLVENSVPEENRFTFRYDFLF